MYRIFDFFLGLRLLRINLHSANSTFAETYHAHSTCASSKTASSGILLWYMHTATLM